MKIVPAFDEGKDRLTGFGPVCWHEIAGTEGRGPDCGFALIQDQALSFEEKLLRSLEHPMPEAIQILGQLGSQAVLTGREKSLVTEVKDIYALWEALMALGKISGSPRWCVITESDQTSFSNHPPTGGKAG